MVKSETLRWQSTSPNLQNIPHRTKEGKQITKAFLPIKLHTGPLSIIEVDEKGRKYDE